MLMGNDKTQLPYEMSLCYFIYEEMSKMAMYSCRKMCGALTGCGPIFEIAQKVN